MEEARGRITAIRKEQILFSYAYYKMASTRWSEKNG
jgi:hypothetical protein